MTAHRPEKEPQASAAPRDGEEAGRGYSLTELMVAAAAREIRDGEWVFVGMRLPMLAWSVARLVHAPRSLALFENGVIRDTPSPELLYTMGDPPNLTGAAQCGGMLDVMGLLQQGRVHVGFLGAAEVDRFGNLNTTWGHRDREMQRLPGSGGGCDIACLARRTVVMLAHERGRLVERIGHITSPGYGKGTGWRRHTGLPPATGPSSIVTTLGVLRFGNDCEAYLYSVHPGISVEEVLANTGWPLRLAHDLIETMPPSPEELTAMRKLDPKRFWTR